MHARAKPHTHSVRSVPFGQRERERERGRTKKNPHRSSRRHPPSSVRVRPPFLGFEDSRSEVRGRSGPDERRQRPERKGRSECADAGRGSTGLLAPERRARPRRSPSSEAERTPLSRRRRKEGRSDRRPFVRRSPWGAPSARWRRRRPSGRRRSTRSCGGTERRPPEKSSCCCSVRSCNFDVRIDPAADRRDKRGRQTAIRIAAMPECAQSEKARANRQCFRWVRLAIGRTRFRNLNRRRECLTYSPSARTRADAPRDRSPDFRPQKEKTARRSI